MAGGTDRDSTSSATEAAAHGLRPKALAREPLTQNANADRLETDRPPASDVRPARRWFLVVDADTAAAETVVRVLTPLVRVRRTASVADAQNDFESHRDLCGCLLDVDLPDGGGVEFLEHLREMCPGAYLVVATASMDPETMSRAYQLGAHWAHKPLGPRDLQRLALDATASVHDWRAGVADVVNASSSTFGLSDAHGQILSARLCGVSRDDLMALRGITVSTWKTHVNTMLRRTDGLYEDLDDFRDALLRKLARIGPHTLRK